MVLFGELRFLCGNIWLCFVPLTNKNVLHILAVAPAVGVTAEPQWLRRPDPAGIREGYNRTCCGLEKRGNNTSYMSGLEKYCSKEYDAVIMGNAGHVQNTVILSTRYRPQTLSAVLHVTRTKIVSRWDYVRYHIFTSRFALGHIWFPAGHSPERYVRVNTLWR